MAEKKVYSTHFMRSFLAETDECQVQPCLNKGTCIDKVGAYQCVCPSTHTGEHCETGQLCRKKVFIYLKKHSTPDWIRWAGALLQVMLT